MRAATGLLLAFLLAVACVPVAQAASAVPPPHLWMILQDDLGYFDTGFHNPGRLDVSTNVTALAKDGIVLKHHYVFYWCSPTRRSFLTGRLPIHHGEMLSADGQVGTYSRTPGYSGDFSSDGDDIDLRWNIISQKLKQKGYANFWYGKGHTGYKSMKHLPVNRGFDHHMGFLTGAQDFYSADRWEGDAPFPNTRGSCTPGVTGCACVPNSPGCANLTQTEKYASNICGERAVASLRAHNASTPYFLYLPWQAVHHPHEAPPDWLEHGDDIGSYRGMLWGTDRYVGELTELFKSKGMYDNMLIVYSADNGGTAGGSNYPLRGFKRTNWEGGMRVAAFVSGGLIPEKLRGTSNNMRFHIVDWYPTFCHLAGIDAADDSPTPPKPIDPALGPSQDIYGKDAWPGLDGVNVWPYLMDPDAWTANWTAAHPTLVLSHEVILVGDFKLLTAERGNTHQGFFVYENGWQNASRPGPNDPTHGDGYWEAPPTEHCGKVAHGPCHGENCVYSPHYWNATSLQPCLFDLANDPQERADLSAAEPAKMRELWTALNTSWYGYFHSRTPAEMLGPCDESCARKKWTQLSGGANLGGPVCGVPGCGDNLQPDLAPTRATIDDATALPWPELGAPKAEWVGGNRPPRKHSYG